MSKRLCWYKLRIENEINFLVVWNLQSLKFYCRLASLSFLWSFAWVGDGRGVGGEWFLSSLLRDFRLLMDDHPGHGHVWVLLLGLLDGLHQDLIMVNIAISCDHNSLFNPGL